MRRVDEIDLDIVRLRRERGGLAEMTQHFPEGTAGRFMLEERQAALGRMMDACQIEKNLAGILQREQEFRDFLQKQEAQRNELLQKEAFQKAEVAEQERQQKDLADRQAREREEIQRRQELDLAELARQELQLKEALAAQERERQSPSPAPQEPQAGGNGSPVIDLAEAVNESLKAAREALLLAELELEKQALAHMEQRQAEERAQLDGNLEKILTTQQERVAGKPAEEQRRHMETYEQRAQELRDDLLAKQAAEFAAQQRIIEDIQRQLAELREREAREALERQQQEERARLAREAETRQRE